MSETLQSPGYNSAADVKGSLQVNVSYLIMSSSRRTVPYLKTELIHDKNVICMQCALRTRYRPLFNNYVAGYETRTHVSF